MASDPVGGAYLGLQLGRKLASLPQSGSIEPARRVIDELRHPLVADAVALPGGAGVVSQSVAGDLAPATAGHVIAQVERELDAQVSMQNREAAAAAAQPVTQGKSMSKLSAIADRISMKKVAHDMKADAWASRLDDLDKREPEAFAAGEAVLSEREMDLAGFESDMRKLSNLGK